jgi:hypothetical protein
VPGIERAGLVRAFNPILPKSAAVLQPYDVSRRWLVVKLRIGPSGATHATPLSTPGLTLDVLLEYR